MQECEQVFFFKSSNLALPLSGGVCVDIIGADAGRQKSPGTESSDMKQSVRAELTGLRRRRRFF